MTSKTEEILSRSLRAILADLPTEAIIPDRDSEQFRRFCEELQWFLPETLAGLHPEWCRESLDGLYPVVARKTAEREAEIFGLCLFISDQTLTPIHLRLQVAQAADALSWLECRVGERGVHVMRRKRGVHAMRRTPYDQLDAALKEIYVLDGNADILDWVYEVTFGDRDP
jgi:hypothetical protein